MDHELFVRLSRARDYLAASATQGVGLEEAAAVACLSKYHFLREFARAFGATPGAFIQRQRIDRARTLLAAENLSVTDVCLEVGYRSPGSFSSLFRRATGESPEQFRRRSGRIFAIRWATGPTYIPGCFIAYFAAEDPQFRRSEAGVIVPV